jgi:hypothetical protein
MVLSLSYTFAIDNHEQLFSVKLNKLREFFQPLCDRIEREHNIVDIRTICHIVVGKPSSRKDFLYHLRSYVQNVRGATTKNESSRTRG